MLDIVSGIKTIDSSFKACISLWNCFARFLIYLVNMNLCCGSVILKCVAECCLCLCFRQYIEVETIHIRLVSDISVWCMCLLDIISVRDWQIHAVACLSVLTCSYCLKSCTLCHNNLSGIVFDVISGIKCVLAAIKRVLCVRVLLYDRYIRFLSCILNRSRFILYCHSLVLILNCYCLRCGIDCISLNALNLCNHISSKMKVR